jgi:hypothetical protein
MGTVEQLRTAPSEPLPGHAEGFDARGRLIDFVSLITVKRTYALYREIPKNAEGRFYPPRT